MSSGIGPPVDDDRAALADFASELHEFLPEILDNQATWFREELRGPLWAAWDELQPRFSVVERFLGEPPDPQVLEAQLTNVGLAGAQLALKRQGWRGAVGRFRERLTKRTLRRALGWANLILGSLAGIVPGAEAIKEYKEAYEQALNDGDEGDEQ